MALTKKQKRAREWVKAHQTQIILHTLYQRWGLPTSLLKPMARLRGQEQR